jgi:hypothetical protein
MRTALTIAGSDPGCGAGIQADLKTFAAFGVYGASAITAITVQNTLGVDAVAPLTADLVTAQIEAVAGDLAIDATKIGMLATAAIVEAVVAAVAALELPLVVVDPVLVSTNGGKSFSKPVKVGDYYELPDCDTYQGAGADPGRACVVEKGPSTNSVFRASNYPVGGVDPTNGNRVVVTFGSYINRNSNEARGCTPTVFAPDGINTYDRVDPHYLGLWFDFIYGELYPRGIIDDRTRGYSGAANALRREFFGAGGALCTPSPGRSPSWAR